MPRVKRTRDYASKTNWPAPLFGVSDIEIMVSSLTGKRKITLHMDLQPYEIRVLADRQLLFSVMSNIVQNAIKYTKVGGNVCIMTRAENGHVVFEVEDECGGINTNAASGTHSRHGQEAMPWEGKPNSGMGRGLSIVDEALIALRGTKEIKNIPDKGCVFKVLFPRNIDESMSPHPKMTS